MLRWSIFIAMASILVINPILFENDARGEIIASVWVPEEVLLDEGYYGLIVLDTVPDSDVIFDIITDNEEAINLITETVTIPKGKHHGMIEFETKGIGNAKIFAIFQDILLEGKVDVVESAATPTELDLILPSNLVNVLVDDNKNFGYVFLLNDFGNPVAANKPVHVELTNNGEITLEKQSVTIEPGNHYAKFVFETMGQGTITSTAANLLPDEEGITLDDSDEIELKLAVAPKPIPTDSSGEIYFWLERDGKPYLPPHDVKVTISIDKSSNLSFDSAIEGAIVLTPNSNDRRTLEQDAKEIITRTEVQLTNDSEREFIIEAGKYYGRAQVYASFDESNNITISGLAKSITPNEDDEVIMVSELLTTSTEKSNSDIATKTRVLAYPDPAYDRVEIIVSAQSDQGPVIEDDDEVFTVFTDRKLRLDISNPSIIKTDENYAIVTADVVDFGLVEIFAERNEAASAEVKITLEGKYVKNPDLKIVPLPIIYNTEQDLFLITSTHNKITTDPDSEDEGSLVSITSRPTFDYNVLKGSESVITVSGAVTQLFDDEPKINVASNAFTATEILDIYNPERKKLTSMHPKNIYPGEAFPIINHVTDLGGNPIRKAELKVSSIANMSRLGDLVILNQTGTHNIIFYDKNSIPIGSSITVKGAPPPVKTAQQFQEERPTFITVEYTLEVTNGQGSGTYPADTEVTISADPVKNDYFVIKDKLVGWKNLSYKEPSVTFELDDDIETEPVYEQDYSLLLAIIGPAGGIGGYMVIRKKKNMTNKDSKKSDEDSLLESLLKD